MDLQVRRELDPAGHDVVVAAGAIDLSSRELFLAVALPAARESGGQPLIVDLSGVTFLDSVGLGALVQLTRDAGHARRDVILRAPSQRVVRVLEIAGLRDVLPIE